jgi:hypothetical protein
LDEKQKSEGANVKALRAEFEAQRKAQEDALKE